MVEARDRAARLAAGTGGLSNPFRPGDPRLFDLGRRRELRELTGHKTGTACLAYGAGWTVNVWDP